MYKEKRLGFNIVCYTFITVFSAICLLPFLLVVSGSFTSESYIINHGYSFIPMSFSVEAYKTVFKVPQEILSAYAVTIFITLVGTVGGLFLSSMTSYVLHRKDFEWRNIFSYFFYFTTLFSGGLVPWYILVLIKRIWNRK